MAFMRVFHGMCDMCRSVTQVRIDDWTVSFQICVDCELAHDVTDVINLLSIKDHK